jgi:cobalt/nickel transport system permease protein
MVDVAKRIFDIGMMDHLSRMESPVHRVDPRAKLIVTLFFIAVVLSFGKYSVSNLMPYLIYPVFLTAAGRIPPKYLLKKMVYVAPFAIIIGAFNPLIETIPMVHIGPVVVSAGWISFASIMVRFALTVGATLALVAVTGLNPLLAAADKLGVPRVLTVQLMFFYRYLFVLANEALRVLRARSLRTVDDRGVKLAGFGSLVGQMLLRTLDRAERIHQAMLARGFEGEIHLTTPLRFTVADGVFVVLWSGLFFTIRVIDITDVIGRNLLGYLI